MLFQFQGPLLFLVLNQQLNQQLSHLHFLQVNLHVDPHHFPLAGLHLSQVVIQLPNQLANLLTSLVLDRHLNQQATQANIRLINRPHNRLHNQLCNQEPNPQPTQLISHPLNHHHNHFPDHPQGLHPSQRLNPHDNPMRFRLFNPPFLLPVVLLVNLFQTLLTSQHVFQLANLPLSPNRVHHDILQLYLHNSLPLYPPCNLPLRLLVSHTLIRVLHQSLRPQLSQAQYQKVTQVHNLLLDPQ